MESAKLSSKSQITIPRMVREQLRLGRGDRIAFEPSGDGRFILGKAEPLRRSDGAARRHLRGAASQPLPTTAAEIMKTVVEDDQRIRAGV